MEKRSIRLQSEDISLAGEIYIPQGSKPLPGLCICHGIPATPYSPDCQGYGSLAQRFCAAGYVTLIFNFRGTGKSQGDFDMLGWSRDLQVALDFFTGLEDVDRSHIYLMGFSGGAAVSIYVASHDPRISHLVACACPAEFSLLANKETLLPSIQHFREIGAIKDEGFPPSPEEWLKGFETISPINWIDRVSPRHLLLVHGDADEVVPLEHAYRLYHKAGEPKDLAIIPGARHKLRLEEAAMDTVLDWIRVKQARAI